MIDASGAAATGCASRDVAKRHHARASEGNFGRVVCRDDGTYPPSLLEVQSSGIVAPWGGESV